MYRGAISIYCISKLMFCYYFLVLGEGFLKYMEAFKPYLGVSLKNFAEHTVSINTKGNFYLYFS